MQWQSERAGAPRSAAFPLILYLHVRALRPSEHHQLAFIHGFSGTGDWIQGALTVLNPQPFLSFILRQSCYISQAGLGSSLWSACLSLQGARMRSMRHSDRFTVAGFTSCILCSFLLPPWTLWALKLWLEDSEEGYSDDPGIKEWESRWQNSLLNDVVPSNPSHRLKWSQWVMPDSKNIASLLQHFQWLLINYSRHQQMFSTKDQREIFQAFWATLLQRLNSIVVWKWPQKQTKHEWSRKAAF